MLDRVTRSVSRQTFIDVFTLLLDLLFAAVWRCDKWKGLRTGLRPVQHRVTFVATAKTRY